MTTTTTPTAEKTFVRFTGRFLDLKSWGTVRSMETRGDIQSTFNYAIMRNVEFNSDVSELAITTGCSVAAFGELEVLEFEPEIPDNAERIHASFNGAMYVYDTGQRITSAKELYFRNSSAYAVL